MINRWKCPHQFEQGCNFPLTSCSHLIAHQRLSGSALALQVGRLGEELTVSMLDRHPSTLWMPRCLSTLLKLRQVRLPHPDSFLRRGGQCFKRLPHLRSLLDEAAADPLPAIGNALSWELEARASRVRCGDVQLLL